MSERTDFLNARSQVSRKVNGRDTNVTIDFTAPYAFIPLEAPLPSAFGDAMPSHARPERDGACGVLTVEWAFERPVLVGGSGRGKQDFAVFATDAAGRPTLPGATTRGLMRSLIEIATCSRMEFYDRDAHFAVRDSDDKRVWKPASPVGQDRALSFGWLRRRSDRSKVAGERDYEGWVIEAVQQAWQLETSTFVPNLLAFEALNVREKMGELEQIRRLRIKANLVRKENAPSYVERQYARYHPQGEISGWVIVTGVDPARGANANATPAPKRFATLFVDQKQDNLFDVPPEVMRRFIKTHNTTPGEGEGAWDFWRERLNKDIEGDDETKMPGIPVFIGHGLKTKNVNPRNQQDRRNADLKALLTRLQSEQGRKEAADDPTLLYLSLSRFPKVPHARSLRQIVEAQGHGLDAPLDFARAMFGQVPPEKLDPEIEEKPGRGALKGRVFFGEARLGEALSPKSEDKIGATMSPRASFWPYYLKPGDPSQPYDYSNPTSEVAGWKRYPVRAQTTPFLRDDRRNAPAAGANGLRSTESGMRFLRATPQQPLVFRGEIRFHNLKPAEIGALLWALTWGDGDDGRRRRQRHLVGRGKAQGYGMCFARVVKTQIEPNLGGAALSAGEYVRHFKDHVLGRWNAIKPGDAAADFESLPMIAALLAMSDPDLAAGLESRLAFPSFPPRAWTNGLYSPPPPAPGMNADSSPSLEGYKLVRDAARNGPRHTSVLPRYPRSK